MSGNKLSAEQNERVRAGMRDLLNREPETQATLAAKLGISQSAVASTVGGRQGSSYPVAREVAKMLGLTVDQLLEGITPPPPSSRESQRYPNRSKAEAFARGEVSDEAIDYVLSMQLKSEGDLTATAWLEMMRHWDQQIRLGFKPGG